MWQRRPWPLTHPGLISPLPLFPEGIPMCGSHDPGNWPLSPSPSSFFCIPPLSLCTQTFHSQSPPKPSTLYCIFSISSYSSWAIYGLYQLIWLNFFNQLKKKKLITTSSFPGCQPFWPIMCNTHSLHAFPPRRLVLHHKQTAVNISLHMAVRKTTHKHRIYMRDGVGKCYCKWGWYRSKRR